MSSNTVKGGVNKKEWLDKLRAEGQIKGHNKTLDGEPELFYSNAFIFKIFNILDSQRDFGFEAPQPISILDILSYFELVGIKDNDIREELLSLIIILDNVTRSEFNKKQKASSNTK